MLNVSIIATAWNKRIYSQPIPSFSLCIASIPQGSLLLVLSTLDPLPNFHLVWCLVLANGVLGYAHLDMNSSFSHRVLP